SKVTIPAWDFISVLFGVGSVAEVNNSKSKFAYLMGSFFLIKKKVLVDVGTFESVREEIQEDKALGIIIKERGYRLRLVKLKNMVYTLWADDLATLWNGIGRTVAPLVMKNKRKIVFNLLVIFFSCVLPFILLPFTLFNALQFIHIVPVQSINDNLSNLELYLTVLSLIMCLLVFIFFSIKRSERGIPISYILGTPFGSGFVFVACLYTVAPLLIYSSTRPIMWQGRKYIQKEEQEGYKL
ncbi:MAG TPA: glycosyltransferase, partial [Candidatus Nitrosocosmicus sp.]|nr:glycosyltransferase [Candidatus Nitrosocosmicus sp.]